MTITLKSDAISVQLSRNKINSYDIKNYVETTNSIKETRKPIKNQINQLVKTNKEPNKSLNSVMRFYMHNIGLLKAYRKANAKIIPYLPRKLLLKEKRKNLKFQD